MSAFNDEHLTVQEAADALRVDPRTVVRHIKSGDLPAARFGRQWRIPADAIRSALRTDTGSIKMQEPPRESA